MKIDVIPYEGPIKEEIEGLKLLEARLPQEWFGYANCELVLVDGTYIEIDVVVIADDRVFLLDLKNWQGVVEADEKGRWRQNGRPRGGSAARKIRENAKKAGAILRQKLNFRFFVDGYVLFSANADFSQLPEEDLAQIMSIADFCDTVVRNQKIARVQTIPTAPVYTERQRFDLRFKLRGGLVRPRTIRPLGFELETHPIWVHPSQLYREYIGIGPRRDSGIVRVWDFSYLPLHLQHEATRNELLSRELSVREYLARNSDLFSTDDYTLERRQSEESYELYEFPRGMRRFNDFVGHTKSRRDTAALLEHVRALLSVVAEIHRIKVAHCDLASHSIWLGPGTRLKLSHWASAHFPSSDTLGPTRELLTGRESARLSPFQRDVRALALLALNWLQSTASHEEATPVTLAQVAAIQAVFAGAAAEDENLKYKDCRELALAVESAVKEAIRPFGWTDDSKLLLQKYFRDLHVSFSFRPYAQVHPNASGELRYESRGEDGCVVCVKIFSAYSRSSALERLLPLLPRLEKLKRIVELGPTYLPLIRDFGLAYDGLFVCYERADGTALSQMAPLPPGAERLQLASALCHAVRRLHEAHIPHGDLSPENILVREESGGDVLERSIIFIDAFDFPSAGGSTRVTTRFAPADYEGAAADERDAFALATILTELLPPGGTSDVARVSLAIQQALNGGWREPAEAIAKLAHEVDSCLDQERCDGARREVTIPVHGVTQAEEVEPDGDRYYIDLKTARSPGELPVLAIAGLRRQLLLDVKLHIDGRVEFNRARVLPIKARQLGWMRNHPERLVICTDISLRLVALAETQLSVDALQSLSIWHGELRARGEGLESRNIRYSDDLSSLKWDDVEERLNSKEVWGRLLDCERSVRDEIRVDEAPYETDFGYGIPVNGWRNSYSVDDRVQVYRLNRTQEERSIGSLVVRYTRNELLMVDLDDPNILPDVGDLLILRSERDEAVRDRKCSAMNRVLSDESPIAGLLDVLDDPSAPRYARGTQVLATAHSEDWFKDRYGLNDGQAAAMVRCLSAAPLFLVQGPPGTGKTKLIGALVHYLVTELGFRNILVASQTHEAVNNAAATISDVFTNHSDALDLVRVGREEDVADELLGVSTAALRLRFVNMIRSEWNAKVELIGSEVGLSVPISAFIGRIHDEVLDPLARAIRSFESSRSDRSARADAEASYAAASATCSKLLGYTPGTLTETSSAGNVVDMLVPHIAGAVGHQDQHSIAKLLEALVIIKELLLRLRTGQGDTAFGEFLVRTNAVVCGTCVGIGLSGLRLKERVFDWVIVDEAGRCTAAELAVAVQTARRIVLVGDHLQLPPFIPSAVGEFIEAEAGPDAGYYLASDFERIFRRDMSSRRRATLTEQYRMAEPVCNIVSELIYKPRGIGLVTRRGPAKEWATSLPNIGAAEVNWIDTSDQGEVAYDAQLSKTDKSYLNRCEAKCIATVVESLLSHAKTCEQLVRIQHEGEWPIGIICTYAAQVLVVEKELQKLSAGRHVAELIRVGTVDSYQGRENAIVIVSLVRSNPQRTIGYLTSLERSNVALSRAQERLVLVGDGATWGHRSNQRTTFGRLWHYMVRGDTPGVTIVSSKKVGH